MHTIFETIVRKLLTSDNTTDVLLTEVQNALIQITEWEIKAEALQAIFNH
jgi:hypothetical protein